MTLQQFVFLLFAFKQSVIEQMFELGVVIQSKSKSVSELSLNFNFVLLLTTVVTHCFSAAAATSVKVVFSYFLNCCCCLLTSFLGDGTSRKNTHTHRQSLSARQHKSTTVYNQTGRKKRGRQSGCS